MEPKVKVHGKEYPLVFEHMMTLGELAEAERITGQGYNLSEGGSLAVLAMTYISVRRVNTAVTLADIEALSGEEFDVIVEQVGDAVVPPTVSEDSNEKDGSSSSSSPNASEGSPDATPEISGVPT